MRRCVVVLAGALAGCQPSAPPAPAPPPAPAGSAAPAPPPASAPAPSGRASLPRRPAPETRAEAADCATATRVDAAAPLVAVDDRVVLASRRLIIPVVGVARAELRDTFNEARGDRRVHDAIDIAAPLGTPVVAVDDGCVVKLFTSKPGGLTVYQFDALGRYAYYYAHLDRYADGLREGQWLRRGEPVGTVGYTGNASPDAPHLHFAIFRLGPEKRWWEGAAINPHPYLVEAP